MTSRITSARRLLLAPPEPVHYRESDFDRGTAKGGVVTMIHGTGVNVEVNGGWPAGVTVGPALEVVATLVWDDCGSVGILVSVSIAGKLGLGAKTPVGGQAHLHYALTAGIDCLKDLNTSVCLTHGVDVHAGIGLGYDMDVAGGPKPQVTVRLSGGVGTALEGATKWGAAVVHKLFYIVQQPCPCPPPPWYVSLGSWVPGIGFLAPVLWREFGADDSKPAPPSEPPTPGGGAQPPHDH